MLTPNLPYPEMSLPDHPPAVAADNLAAYATPPEWSTIRVAASVPPSAALQLPGSKSICNRLLACAALADGDSRIHDAALCEDTRRMVRGLRALGIDARLHADLRRIDVRGCGGAPPAEEVHIDAGDAGTAMRFLTALACLGFGSRRLDGSARMRERPIGGLVDALRGLGAGISYLETEGCAPLHVEARGLFGGQVAFERPPSSQFLSAVFQVAPYAADDVLISVAGGAPSRPYLELTARTMRQLGVDLLHDPAFQRIIIPASQRYAAGEYIVEPDASGATYFWAAAAATGGAVRTIGLQRDSAQGDVGFVDVLAQMGCAVEAGADYLELRGPAAGRLRGVDVDLNAMPDTVQTLAVLALLAEGPTRIRNVANLRVKETDRLAALEAELRKLGAQVETTADGLMLTPPPRLPAEALIATYDDHRMAMSFAVLGLAGTPVRIANPACVAKSFPEFWGYCAALGAELRAD